jgi:hypothetical protein
LGLRIKFLEITRHGGHPGQAKEVSRVGLREGTNIFAHDEEFELLRETVITRWQDRVNLRE